MKPIKFAIITHVIHTNSDNQYFGYGPYVREMNIWIKYVDEVIILAPVLENEPQVINVAYKHNNINFVKIPDFNFTSFKNVFKSIFKLPIIFWKIFWVMKNADHIHLRCPGNVGLIGCLVQILFPNKIKTAKYAGNWDPESKQPWTYKLQKRILSNVFLTRNMTVLVYGDWKNQTKNIKSFFTATYSEKEKVSVQIPDHELVKIFVFVGSLVPGKNPLYVIKIIESLINKGYNTRLNIYGEGVERNALENYIKTNQLENYVYLFGGQNHEMIKKAYQKSHFVVLPSKSEGWPKAVAEGMFWGCVPIATSVSCVPYMLDHGNRGVLIDVDLEKDLSQIESLLLNSSFFLTKSKLARDWSEMYTTEVFEMEIKKLLFR